MHVHSNPRCGRVILLAALAGLAACSSDGPPRPPEADCFNGIDDNGDGLEDCRDPTCLPVAECVAAAAGFDLGTQVGPEEACPDAFPDADVLLGQGLTAGTACGTCECGAPEAECWGPMLPYESADCSGAPVINYAQVSSAYLCSGVGNTINPMRSVQIPSLSLHLGGCQPSNPITPTTWGERRRFCGTIHLGGGCGTGQVCAPRVTDHCALAAGAQACPAGYAQANQASWYTRVDDQRVCPCACGAATGLSCAEASVEVFAASSCAGTGTPAGLGECVAGEFGQDVSAKVVGGPGGSCAPSSLGAMTGAAAPAGEETLCCIP